MAAPVADSGAEHAKGAFDAEQFIEHCRAYKPASFVSYGGVSAGTRGVQPAKAVTSTPRILTIA